MAGRPPACTVDRGLLPTQHPAARDAPHRRRSAREAHLGQLDRLYRHLETEGRSDGSGGRSPRSVQYVHTIIGAALNSAVEGGVLKVNVAKRAHPPMAKEARAEEMKVWTPDEVAIFFAWAQDHMDRELRTAFQVLLASGMRRGELLALRWRDLDLNGGTVAVRRSVGTIKVKGESTRRHEGPTKNGKDRVVDLDPATVDLLREHRKLRAGLAFQLGTGEALVFGNEEGQHRVPETFSRSFADGVGRCQRWQVKQAKKQGLASVETIGTIRLHDLRHKADGGVMCPVGRVSAGGGRAGGVGVRIIRGGSPAQRVQPADRGWFGLVRCVAGRFPGRRRITSSVRSATGCRGDRDGRDRCRGRGQPCVGDVA